MKKLRYALLWLVTLSAFEWGLWYMTRPEFAHVDTFVGLNVFIVFMLSLAALVVLVTFTKELLK